MTDNSSRRVATNATYLFISQLLTWGLSLLVAIMLPRYFGATGIGQYHLAGSLWAIAALLIGFGTDVVITREIARDNGRTSELVSVGILLRILMHLVGFTAVAIFANLAGYAPETIQIVYVFGVANLIYQIGHVFSAALYGLEKMGRLSAVGLLTEVVSTLGMIALILANQSIVTVALVSILAGFVRTLLLWFILRREYPMKLQLRFSQARWLLHEGFSILGNRLVRNAYVQADVIIISLFVNETVVGWYSVADVAFGSLLFLPNLVGTAIFPTFSRLYKQDQTELKRLTKRTLHLLLLAVVPLGLGTAVIATPILVLIVGPDFVNSGILLSGFGVVAIFTSVNTFLAQLLIAMEKQNRLTFVMALAVGLTYPIDIVLIPWTQAQWGNGAIGGVIAYLITELVIMVGSLRLLPAGYLNRETAVYTTRVLISGAVMFAICWFFKDRFIVWPILIGIITYALMVLLMRLVSREDVELARSTATHIWQRLSRRASRVQPSNL